MPTCCTLGSRYGIDTWLAFPINLLCCPLQRGSDEFSIDSLNRILLRNQAAQFLKRPHMIRQASFHGGSDAQRLVNAAEVVMEEVDRDLVRVVRQLLTKSVREPSKTAHPHPH